MKIHSFPSAYPSLRLLAALGAVAALVGCGGSDSTGPSHVVTAVSIVGGRDTLYVGQTMDLSASVQIDSASSFQTDTVTWTSGDTTRAVVNAAGVVTARTSGAVTITASLAGHSGHLAISIGLIPVSSITVSPASRLLYLAQVAHLTATVKDSAGTAIVGRAPTWTSSDGSVATVDSLGNVTAHDTGAVRISASLSGHADSAAVTVTVVPVAEIAVIPAGDTALVGDTLRPIAIPEDSTGAALAGRQVTWSVSDSNALAPAGPAAFLAAGSGTITLTAKSGTASRAATILLTTCGDTVQMATGAFHFPLTAGQLAHDASGTTDAGAFSGTPAFYGGGVMFGTDSAHMVVAYDPRGDVGDGAEHVGVCTLTHGGGLTYSYTKIRAVAGEGTPAGLRVVQESFASAAAADSSFVLFRYTFTDTSSTAVTGLRVGYFVDWDLNFDSDPSMDVIRYYAGLGYAEAEEADTVAHTQRLSIVPIATSGSPSFGGWVNGGTPGDPATRGAYFGRLAAGTVSSPIGPQDIRQLVGAGPLSVPAHGRLVVYFALVGGANQAGFAANRSSAIALANSLGFN